MTAKHQTAEYRRNAKLRRQQVTASHRRGEAVACWRGGGAILPGQHYDIGHLSPDGGESLSNLAPEHRSRVAGCCLGNRAHGGLVGAAMTNARPAAATTPREVTTWRL